MRRSSGLVARLRSTRSRRTVVRFVRTAVLVASAVGCLVYGAGWPFSNALTTSSTVAALLALLHGYGDGETLAPLYLNHLDEAAWFYLVAVAGRLSMNG